jgi:hypothetical protein
MRWLVGLDDTDNLESRGTGYLSRLMANRLHEQGLASIHAITRHQLLVSPEIPYTSHNSAACILLCSAAEAEQIWSECRETLLAMAAPGSDAGLCLAPALEIPPAVQVYGVQAKKIVLDIPSAVKLAGESGFRLEGLTGTGGGVIGALAAVGLRAGGNDGRFLWLPGIRELSGRFSVDEILAHTGIDELRTLDGKILSGSQIAVLGEWTRPILISGKAVLLMEEVVENGQSEWHLLAKESVKQISD